MREQRMTVQACWPAGMDELMKLLTSVGDKSNIFVISHKSDQLVDKFQNLITFEKKNNFSRML